MNILVTAGPTREPLDPVRFLSNRSSGRMGYAVAQAALSNSHNVRLISGPVSLQPPDGIDMTSITTADEMLNAVCSNFAWCDALVMTAAVCDWRPASCSDTKLKKSEMTDSLQLERTTDILVDLATVRRSQIMVGFAAETENLEAEARRKLEAKHLDLVVANDVSRQDAGFESETNAALFVSADSSTDIPLMSKDDLAIRIIEWVEERST